MGVHPATMALLDFLAVGTQLKIEYPGKGNCVVPVDSIEGPIVKLKNGDVVKIDKIKQAKELKNQVAEILFFRRYACCIWRIFKKQPTINAFRMV